MAIVLQFKQGDSGTTLSLNSASAGFSLAGWSPSVATPVHMGDPAPIGEAIHLRLKQANQNTLATSMQSLHEMQVYAETYRNDVIFNTPVWLHAKMANETGERRALVHSISAQYKSSWFGPEATSEDIPLVLNVVRSPYWESTTARTFPGFTSGATISTVYNYTASASADAHDIVGDVGARIDNFQLNPGSTDSLGMFWMGIRSRNKWTADNLANFALVWECEDGTNNANESGITDEVDATASGGDVVQLVETDLNWDAGTFLEVCHITAGNVDATNADDLHGLMLWLLRAKVASGTWEVQLRWGYPNMADANYIKGSIVEFTSTSWVLKEMGTKPNPLNNIHVIDLSVNDSAEYGIQIWARRTSGSGNLTLDGLFPVPLDEGFMKLAAPTDFGALQKIQLGQDPLGQWDAAVKIAAGTGITQTGIINNINNFELPPGDGYIVCVFSDYASSDITDLIDFADQADLTSYYERWLSLRGTE